MDDELRGFEFLKDMTREQLIDEIVVGQRELMQESSMDNLRANVIDLRVKHYKDRLCSEAGLIGSTLFGYIAAPDDDGTEYGK